MALELCKKTGADVARPTIGDAGRAHWRIRHGRCGVALSAFAVHQEVAGGGAEDCSPVALASRARVPPKGEAPVEANLVSMGIYWPWRASFELDAGLAADCCNRAAGETAEPMGFGCRVLKRRALRAKNLL